MKALIEKKANQYFETQGEWIYRIAGNIARCLALSAIVIAVAVSVVYIATKMWANLALALVAIIVLSFALANRD